MSYGYPNFFIYDTTKEQIGGEMMVGEVYCVRDFVEDGDLYWTNGCHYDVVGEDSGDFLVKNNFGGVGRIYAEDFSDYFIISAFV